MISPGLVLPDQAQWAEIQSQRHSTKQAKQKSSLTDYWNENCRCLFLPFTGKEAHSTKEGRHFWLLRHHLLKSFLENVARHRQQHCTMYAVNLFKVLFPTLTAPTFPYFFLWKSNPLKNFHCSRVGCTKSQVFLQTYDLAFLDFPEDTPTRYFQCFLNIWNNTDTHYQVVSIPSFGGVTQTKWLTVKVIWLSLLVTEERNTQGFWQLILCVKTKQINTKTHSRAKYSLLLITCCFGLFLFCFLQTFMLKI